MVWNKRKYADQYCSSRFRNNTELFVYWTTPPVPVPPGTSNGYFSFTAFIKDFCHFTRNSCTYRDNPACTIPFRHSSDISGIFLGVTGIIHLINNAAAAGIPGFIRPPINTGMNIPDKYALYYRSGSTSSRATVRVAWRPIQR